MGSSEHVKETTDGTFDSEVLKSEQPALVDFWAAWCGPCRMIAPIVDQLADEHQGKLSVFKMDVDANPATPGKYNVRGIPSLILFKGGEAVETIVGVQPKEAIAEVISKHI